ncbi:MAG: AraC family transcriptional regulator [Pseudomonadota bacterium]
MAMAQEAPNPSQGLDDQVQSLKKSVLELNRELFILEEELLFPGNTQVSVFLSMDVGAYFKLDSVQLKIDDKELSNYLYTEREVKALHRGGTQRLFLGNLKSGEHELVAFFTGIGPKERDYKRGATIEFSKGVGPKFIELKIVDNPATQQPDFKIREWE